MDTWQKRKIEYLNNNYGEERLINVFEDDDIVRHCVIKNIDDFKKSIGLHIDDLPMGMFISGGSVLGTLSGKKFDDIDIFFYGKKLTEQKIKSYILDLCDKYNIKTIRAYGQIAYSIKIGDRYYQFIFRSYKTREECIVMFDFDCCCFIYDPHDNGVYTIPRGKNAIITKRNYLIRMGSKKVRFNKYIKVGYKFIISDNSNKYYNTSPLLYSSMDVNNISIDKFKYTMGIIEYDFPIKPLKIIWNIDHCYICRKYIIKTNELMDSTWCRKCKNINESMKYEIISKMENGIGGRLFIVTGCRVKLGYNLVKFLLINGATVIGTTRYPNLAMKKFKESMDTKYLKNLDVHGLDLLDLKSVHKFIEKVNTTKQIVLINNAAQTIYESISDRITMIGKDNKEGPGQRSLIDINTLIDIDDTREISSWNAGIDKLMDIEIYESIIINSIAPLIMIKGLVSKMEAGSIIINVTSMEGSKFIYSGKLKGSDRHVHTNGTKAYLDQITYSCGIQFARKGIRIVSVDPGWLSSYRTTFKSPQLSMLDGVCRILQPIVDDKFYGVKLKDYKVYKDE
jgi:NAD(P)-dependent dehydrogenase (short-subunit alcohol dehydrogenase family)